MAEQRRLFDEFENARFSVMFGRSYEEVKQVAYSKDFGIAARQDAWLSLLQWQLEHLEEEPLRTLIYMARENGTPADKRFLEGVARVIMEKPRAHANRKEFVSTLFKIYRKDMSFKDLINAITGTRGIDDDTETPRKYLKRHGLLSKDFS